MRNIEEKARKLKRMQATKRMISKRLKVVKNEWALDLHGFREEHPFEKIPNKLNKFNLRCGCRACRTHDDNPRKRNNGKEVCRKKKISAMDED